MATQQLDPVGWSDKEPLDELMIKRAQNGYCVYAGAHEIGSLTSWPFVFESFESLQKWLQENLAITDSD